MWLLRISIGEEFRQKTLNPINLQNPKGVPPMPKIRQATENDTHYIYEINKYAFGYEYREEKTKERLKYILNRQTDKIWVACEGDLVVGYIHSCL